MTVPASSDLLGAGPRRVLLVVNTRRASARSMAAQFCTALTRQQLVVRLLEEDAAVLGPEASCAEAVAPGPAATSGCELVVVIGGDGTILRAAELARDEGTPLLGINLGHVGFLAEADPEDVEHTIEAVVDRSYRVEERLTLDVRVWSGGHAVATTWALNEASVEKASRERMLEVMVGVDHRPLSRWGCDGVVCATPTGSTAYNFSAGGPVVWPDVEALLLVPLSAHALFARPMVVGPHSVLTIDLIADTDGAGVLWCDGRRTWELPPGSRVEVRRSDTPIRLARLHEVPFSGRLVAKFGLPVAGWRGAAEQRSLHEDRGAPQEDRT
ncbi:MAG: NAD kinase [uncultured Nocardioidaceae bacterium]|uniref:NAD kinase n=1 Tax=uncultured Nocardioidaceae bacterium TaxID=253824 RepID=A0A6J4MDL2_9ACTN|nr:MAG: NAD kinase [uncultured Nocardioidaceae bacterium]